MTIQQSFFSASVLILVTFFYAITTASAQLSPVQAPAAVSASPPAPTLPQSPLAAQPAAAPASPPGMSTVPLVPVSPNVAPTPARPKRPTIDIVQILTKAKRFSVLIRLLKTTQLINQLNSQLVTSGSSGLTIFAPEDSAFGKLKAGFLNSLNDRQKVELLQFHTISSFISISNFDTLTNPVQTQAGDDPARLQLNVTTFGGSQVSMTTGAANATVTGTVYSDNKLAIYQVDRVLLPLDFVLPKPKAKAPSPAAGKADSPKSAAKSSSADDQSGAGDNGNSDDAGNVNSSEGSKVEVMLTVPLAAAMALVGGAIMI